MIQGLDVFISKNAEITRSELCTIGNHVAIDSGFYCTTQLSIGDYVHISPHVAVIGGKKTGLFVEDFCFISVGAKMVCGSEMFYGDGLIGPLIPDELKDRQKLEPIYLKRFSGVCANSVVCQALPWQKVQYWAQTPCLKKILNLGLYTLVVRRDLLKHGRR